MTLPAQPSAAVSWCLEDLINQQEGDDVMDGEQNKEGLVEKVVGRMMGGSTDKVKSGGVEVMGGTEYGRTPYSEEPERFYE